MIRIFVVCFAVADVSTETELEVKRSQWAPPFPANLHNQLFIRSSENDGHWKSTL